MGKLLHWVNLAFAVNLQQVLIKNWAHSSAEIIRMFKKVSMNESMIEAK